ncbi:MAG: hypothetical protein M1832_005388 [Thelocarpon impressellum]|nr:MAG: hypothetical protein M1832_005388 [Thelocarpon impressellum]
MIATALSTSLVGLADLVRGAAGSATWGPVVDLSRRAVCMSLSRLEHGEIEIVDTDATVLRFGETLGEARTAKAELRVHKEAFWVRLFLFTDMGFAEAFMLGEVACPDLTAFFQIFIRNRAALANGTTLTSSVMSTVTGLARSTNTLSNSRLNVSAHYDISNDMFAAFLSDDMTYSCPIWAPKGSPQALTETLEQAQGTKLQRFVTNARIKPADHVLEIGTGWGSFAMEAVRSTGCRVTSLTLSVEQKELAEKRIAAAGLSNSITVLLCDYRKLPTPDVLYDKVVSIEMLEAVGREFLVTYFERVDRLLKKDGGIAVFQCITIPESRYEAYCKSEDFIQKYIFPGGHLPTVSQLVSSIDQGSRGTLVVDGIENIAGHYAKTLRQWRQRFNQNFDVRIKPALIAEHNADVDLELFRRKWEYYFSYSEAGFATKTLGDVIITAAREGAMETLEDIEL